MNYRIETKIPTTSKPIEPGRLPFVDHGLVVTESYRGSEVVDVPFVRSTTLWLARVLSYDGQYLAQTVTPIYLRRSKMRFKA